MKKIFLIISVFTIFCFSNVYATNSLNSINMDIYIDNNGNANITEVWDTYNSGKTEMYHPYFNLGKSTIIFNSVSDDRGVNYTQNYNWDINNSFDLKKDTFGIYNDGDEYDLCWGISEYGNRVYTIKYTISNFISNTTDGYQVLYWTLIPKGMSDGVGNYYLKIHSDNIYRSSLPVWGYGNKGGTLYVYDGYIEGNSKSSGISSDEYFTVLVKFNKGTFNTTNSIDKSWDEIYDMAESGTTGNGDYSFLLDIIGIVFSVLIIGGSLIVFIISYHNKSIKKKYEKIYNKIDLKDVLPFRDIPFGDKYMYANYIAYQYDLVDKKTNILGAIFLKWIKDGNMSITTEEKGLFKNKHTKFILNNDLRSSITDPSELDLWDIVCDASCDNILEDDEFKKYCKREYVKIGNWFDGAIDRVDSEVKNNSKYVTKSIETVGKHEYTKYSATDLLNEDAKKLAGMKEFFHEFTSMDEKEVIEVKLWRDYLIYAQILGCADEVAKEFKKLYPDVITDDYYSDIVLVNTFYTGGVDAYTTAEARARSYNAGGGGYTFGGGGFGSFGGGGSGGGAR